MGSNFNNLDGLWTAVTHHFTMILVTNLVSFPIYNDTLVENLEFLYKTPPFSRIPSEFRPTQKAIRY